MNTDSRCLACGEKEVIKDAVLIFLYSQVIIDQ